MVDFKKRIAGKKSEKPIDPVALYETLDRASDKGPLRPAQTSVLTAWHEKHRDDKDVIIKLHTGQGKTLTGLLMLQAQLNAGKGPALYLCPNNYLIAQTCDQASQFGIATCTAEPELPTEFISGNKILVTSVQKLFNGLTKFGLHNQSIIVGTIVMDDAHACADTIRDQTGLRIPRTEPAYNAIKALFNISLEEQGVGTYADICNAKREALLPIPYWAWGSKISEIANILSGNADRKPIKFAWPLLKDNLLHCQCVISGEAVEIEPYIPPLEAFGSFWKAQHRIFMSATVTDDAFLIKGLRLRPETVVRPLTYDKETWSGEKMILLPSLIHDDLDRENVISQFSKPNSKRKFGRVALVPSFLYASEWGTNGSVVATAETLEDCIDQLKEGKYETTVVLANRYDGIDLPDSSCRILVFDSRPFSESLIDLYQAGCRPNSDATLMRTVRTVEQGMGRSVRGEKDYCVIVVTGTDLVRLLRNKGSRKYLSSQMSTQIEIGLEISDMARLEIEDGGKPLDAFHKLIAQCLSRDGDWKTFYAEQMANVSPSGANEKILRLYAAELSAERYYIGGDYSGASNAIQKLLDAGEHTPEDRGWYLQEMARYNYAFNRSESERLQISAHRVNRLLLKPPVGVTITKLAILSQGRVQHIIEWVQTFEKYGDLNAVISDILATLVFGTKADKFEAALNDLGLALGFAGERPDAEWREGPDNLWALDTSQYLLWECKNEVDVKRTEINKAESDQMNKSSVWFDKHYEGMRVKRIIVHPAYVVQSAASFSHDVEAMRETELRKLVKATRNFYKSFEALDFRDLSTTSIQKALNDYGLSVPCLLSDYSKKLKDLK